MTVPASVESGLYVGVASCRYSLSGWQPMPQRWRRSSDCSLLALRQTSAWYIERDPDYIFREWEALPRMHVRDLYWDWQPPRDEIPEMTDGDLWAA